MRRVIPENPLFDQLAVLPLGLAARHTTPEYSDLPRQFRQEVVARHQDPITTAKTFTNAAPKPTNESRTPDLILATPQG